MRLLLVEQFPPHEQPEHRPAERRLSRDTPPSLSAERAVLLTEFYEKESGRQSAPVLRALSFLHLCQHKTLYLGDGELIVGERGPSPKVVPTYPELNCHSAEDLRILNSRPKTWCGQAGSGRRGAESTRGTLRTWRLHNWRRRAELLDCLTF